MLTQDRLKEFFHYCEETGHFTRIKTVRGRGSVKGSIAGTKMQNGYLKTCIDNKEYLLHRLAWLYVHGVWPDNMIDHINQIKDDNRFCNLRQATRSENMRNTVRRKTNKTGVKGVTWSKQAKKYVAQITLNYKNINLGSFSTKEEAAKAYAEAAKKLHKEFAYYE